MEQNENPVEERSVTLWLFLGILLAVAVATAAVRAIVEGRGLLWLFEIPKSPANVGDIASILTPLLAVSVAIERLLEAAFDWYEQSIHTVADALTVPVDGLNWVEQELQNAHEATRIALGTTKVTLDGEPLDRLRTAEERLTNIEQQVRNWTKSSKYIAWKRALCIWFGLLVGLEIAILGDLGMFRLVGFSTPRLLDMLVTGLVLGSGPGPMHSVIGILQSGKETLDNLADLAKAKSVRSAAEVLGESV